MPKGARLARSLLCADMTAQQSCSCTTPYLSARPLTARHSTVQQTVQPLQPRTRGRTFMPLLEIVPSKKVTATVSLEEPTAIRAELQTSGVVSKESHSMNVLTPRSDLTSVDRTWAARYQPGDVLHYTRGSKQHSI